MCALREPLGDTMRELFIIIIYYEVFLYFFPNQFIQIRSGVKKSGVI